MTRSRLVAGGPFSYGLGIFNIARFLGHNGGIYGYSTFMVHRPEDRATFVTATNLADYDDGGADAIWTAIARVLYPGMFPA